MAAWVADEKEDRGETQPTQAEPVNCSARFTASVANNELLSIGATTLEFQSRHGTLTLHAEMLYPSPVAFCRRCYRRLAVPGLAMNVNA